MIFRGGDRERIVVVNVEVVVVWKSRFEDVVRAIDNIFHTVFRFKLWKVNGCLCVVSFFESPIYLVRKIATYEEKLPYFKS